MVAGGRVSLLHVESGRQQDVVADEAGRYSFPTLSPGNYRLEAASPGFALFRQRIVLNANETARVYPVLPLGSVTETVVVSFDPPRGAPPSPAAPVLAVRAGGRLEPAKLLAQQRPPYPEKARARGAQGVVVLQATIKTDGSLSEPLVIHSPDPDLATAALEAVRQWRYQPTRLNSQPMETLTTISISYQPARP